MAIEIVCSFTAVKKFKSYLWFLRVSNFCSTNFQILARFSPMLLSGAEEELINFLKDGDEIIKEGVLHVLAKAGGTIREQLAVSTRCNLKRCRTCPCIQIFHSLV